jgi:hypothetical protein
VLSISIDQALTRAAAPPRVTYHVAAARAVHILDMSGRSAGIADLQIRLAPFRIGGI